MKLIWSVLAMLLLFISCDSSDQVAVPKPRVYPRVIYPEKAYTDLVSSDCPFTFEKPVYAKVQKDTAFFDEKPVHPCWFDLLFPDFDARVHFSYYPIGLKKDFEQLRQDAFVLAQKHNIKANYIDEIPFEKSEAVKGIIFQLEGAVASPVQFYVSDEKEHFLRGSLYFNTQARPDSLAPIVSFLKDDIGRCINSINWK